MIKIFPGPCNLVRELGDVPTGMSHSRRGKPISKNCATAPLTVTMQENFLLHELNVRTATSAIYDLGMLLISRIN